jgi:hypothetical protein
METEPQDQVDLIGAIVARLCTVYGVPVSDDLTTGYVSTLEDIEPEFVEIAADELLKESTWMPKPAEIRKTAKRIASECPAQPAEPDHWRRDAYRCQTCRDTGYVTVWHPTAMQSAIWHTHGLIARERLRLPTCDARCSCAIGDLKPSGVRKRKFASSTEAQEPVRFKSPPTLRVDAALSPADQIAGLLAWAASWQPKEKTYEWDPNRF